MGVCCLSSRRAYDWLREAEEDLESAQLLIDGGQYHHACFHVQQAAEKALKVALLPPRYPNAFDIGSPADHYTRA